MKPFADRSPPFVRSMRVRATHAVLVLVASLLCLVGTARGQCGYEWQEGFNLPGADGPVHTAVVFDDGTGAALYIGGDFEHVDQVAAPGIAKWDGATWSAPARAFGGENSYVLALLAHDDGNGPALFVGGDFRDVDGVAVNNLAKWDGANWLPVGGGTSGPVGALAEFDDGAGAALYAGGRFTTAGDAAVMNVARWDGTDWSALAQGISGSFGGYNTWIYELEVFDEDGDGPQSPALFAAGNFSVAGTVGANNVARWNGQAWSAVGAFWAAPQGGTLGYASALEVFDPDGDGPSSGELYVGGSFNSAGGASAENVARWTGTQWLAMPAGPGGAGCCASVHSLEVFDDGTGPALFVGGAFNRIADATIYNLAMWDGGSWSAVGGGIGGDISTQVRSLVGLPATITGERTLFVGGIFVTASGVPAGGIARWNGSSWDGFGEGIGQGDDINALAVFDEGNGPVLFMVRNAAYGGSPVMRFETTHWSVMGQSLSGTGNAVVTGIRDSDKRPMLYAGGRFVLPDVEGTCPVIAWDGDQWIPVMSGLNGVVLSLAIVDDGSGQILYACGVFDTDGPSVPGFHNLAAWDGSTWTYYAASPMVRPLRALCAFDDGHGPALYAGGDFDQVDGVPANRVARWDGKQWSALGDGVSQVDGPEHPFGMVTVLATFNDGSGPAMFAGGSFNTAGGQPAHGIARWNGSDWRALDEGISGPVYADPHVRALAAFDDGTGPSLLVAGKFDAAGGEPARNVAKWQGMKWWPLTEGIGDLSASVNAVAVVPRDNGQGQDSYFGGSFDTAAGIPSHNIAKWSPGDLPPRIVHEPDDRTRPPGGSTTFNVTIESGAATYQWRHDSSPLIDDDRITGSIARTLTITNLQESDTGQYEVVITNDCGEAITQPAELLVRAQCAADITGINGAVDIADFQIVINAWGPCVACPADVNGDGLVNTDDLLAVISQWGPCP